MKETYIVEEYTIGSKEGAERIIFADKKQLRKARQAFEDAQDIEIKVKDENNKSLIIIVSHKMISDRLYKGEIILASRDKEGKGKDEEKEGEK